MGTSYEDINKSAHSLKKVCLITKHYYTTSTSIYKIRQKRNKVKQRRDEWKYESKILEIYRV